MGYDLVIGDAFVVPGDADSPSVRVWAETVRHPDAPRLSVADVARVDAAASAEGSSRSAWVRSAIEAKLGGSQ